MNMYTTISGARATAPALELLHVGNWQESPVATAYVSAIVEMHALASRLEALRCESPSLHEARDAASTVGRVINKSSLREFGRGRELLAAPSSGACAVSVLWEALAAIRENAISEQLKAEGCPRPYDTDLTQEQADAAFDRREELDRDALSVAQVVCLALSEGRA